MSRFDFTLVSAPVSAPGGAAQVWMKILCSRYEVILLIHGIVESISGKTFALATIFFQLTICLLPGTVEIGPGGDRHKVIARQDSDIRISMAAIE